MSTENKRIEFIEKNEAMDIERAMLKKQLKHTEIKLKRSETTLLKRMESDASLVSPTRRGSGIDLQMTKKKTSVIAEDAIDEETSELKTSVYSDEINEREELENDPFFE